MNDVTNANSRKIENRLHLCWRLDGLKWTALNNDKPVVTSSMSTKAIRDPAILRKQDGTFVLMYTDAAWSVGLKPTCGFWDSPDIVNWTNQRICTLSGNPAVQLGDPRRFTIRRQVNTSCFGPPKRAIRSGIIRPLISTPSHPRPEAPFFRSASLISI
jgi:sucrose-6-phosphate hydrolase SacC (GH32 family)